MGQCGQGLTRQKDRNSGEAIHGEPGQGRGRSREINRDEYTNESLAKLDQALAAADVLLAGSTYTEQDVNDVIKLVADAIAGLAQKEVSSLTVTPSKTTYQVGDAIDADHDLKVVGNYSAGMGNVTLSADQFTLDYDFSAPADAAKVP